MATIQTLEAYDSGADSRSKINSNFTNLNSTTGSVAEGGTGATSFTDGGVLIGNGTGAIQATAVGTAGQVLTSNGPGLDPTFTSAAGAGSVTSVSVATANGFSGTVSNATTTPDITIIAGAITPTSVATATIFDANGSNEAIKITATASAVNEITLANAATGANPNITPSGGDSNIGLDITPKGTGTLNVKGNATQAGTIRLYEDTDLGTNYTSLKVGTQSADIDYTLPTSAPAASGQLLSATTGGVMSWSSVTPASKVNINTTEVTITDGATTTETTLFTTTLSGGTLSTNNAIKIEAYLSDIGLAVDANTLTLRLKYGATTIASTILTKYGAGSTADLMGKISGLIVADGATGAQKGCISALFTKTAGFMLRGDLFTSSQSLAQGEGYGSAAEDSTADKAITLTAQYDGTNAANDITAEFWVVTKIN